MALTLALHRGAANSQEANLLLTSVQNGLRSLAYNRFTNIERMKAVRKMFLRINRGMVKGTLFWESSQMTEFFKSAHERSMDLIEQDAEIIRNDDSDGYASILKRTLRKTAKMYRELYRDRVKMWYSYSLDKVPLDVNHIIISYLVLPSAPKGGVGIGWI